jgi:aspartyl/asparaginyl beta-hydroxylase (cupin superfamily)
MNDQTADPTNWKQADALLQQAQQVAQQGLDPRALLQRALGLCPQHVPSWQMLARVCLTLRDLPGARHAHEQWLKLCPQDQQGWVHLAMVHRASGAPELEESAIRRALELEPQDLMALILRANLMERLGRRHEAFSAYQGVIAVAPPMAQLLPELRPALQRALEFRDGYNRSYGDFVERFIEQQGQGLTGGELDRFRHSLDLMFGRKKRYESQPMGYFFPGLQPVEFFPRSDFPWLEALESQTAAIRAEFLAVLGREQGFEPYLDYASDAPLNQWAELNRSPRWSAYHLIKDGRPVPDHASQCPQTMTALAQTPQPEQPGRTPVAMFSLLKPRTRIPPHVGISNARLVTHLPLIVPPGCGFRVGNETREWVPGQAWVFDDTIEHEAWNDSDQLRVVLIFDVWHPALSPQERRWISALAQAQQAFLGAAGGYAL